MKDETRIVHAGRRPREHFGAVNTPVFRVSTVLAPTLKSLDAADQPYTYGRQGTPTTRSLEEAICTLEGGHRTWLTPSGLSAMTAAILSVAKTGEHVLLPDSVYGPTKRFCEASLPRWGITWSAYDPLAAPDAIFAAAPASTRVLFLESPGSLTFEVQDVPALAAAARVRGVVSMVDNTWATPVFCKPLALGADLSLNAATKYVVGHADAMMGTITANAALAGQIEDFHHNFGLMAAADEAYLALRGLRTMAVRLPRHQETATRLAEWFLQRPEVERVLYPALPSDPGHAVWRRDFTGASGLFGVVLKPVTREALGAMLDGLTLFGMGYSWGGFESLVIAPKVKRKHSAFHADGPLLRFHAGLEDAGDLIADLEAGFARLAGAA